MAIIKIEIPDGEYNQFLRRFAKRMNKPKLPDPRDPEIPEESDSDFFGNQIVSILRGIDQQVRVDEAEDKEAEKAKPLIRIQEIDRENRP